MPGLFKVNIGHSSDFFFSLKILLKCKDISGILRSPSLKSFFKFYQVSPVKSFLKILDSKIFITVFSAKLIDQYAKYMVVTVYYNRKYKTLIENSKSKNCKRHLRTKTKKADFVDREKIIFKVSWSSFLLPK